MSLLLRLTRKGQVAAPAQNQLHPADRVRPSQTLAEFDAAGGLPPGHTLVHRAIDDALRQFRRQLAAIDQVYAEASDAALRLPPCPERETALAVVAGARANRKAIEEAQETAEACRAGLTRAWWTRQPIPEASLQELAGAIRAMSAAAVVSSVRVH